MSLLYRISLALLLSIPVAAQTVTGSLVGHVVDSSDAGMTGVKVTATEVTRGTTREAVTNEGGNYNISSMDPGRYTTRP